MGNYSNPELSVSRASVSDTSATLDVTVTNTSDFDLMLTAIDYQLTHGPFPVAEGVYRGEHNLPKGGDASFRMQVPLDNPSMDPSADQVEFSGEMLLDDPSNKKNMRLENAAFSVTAPVR